jgi:hypothetical protein
MPLPWSRCGNYDLHEPHRDWNDRGCYGWDKADQVTRDLFTKTSGYLAEHYGPLMIFPEGLRLEMHPSVRRAMMLCRDLWGPSGITGDPIDQFQVPAKVTMDVPEGTWRLVIVTEEVLLTG